MKNFEFYEKFPEKNQNHFEIIYKQSINKNSCQIKLFIEILYRIYNENLNNLERNLSFKKFLDNYIFKTMKKYYSQFFENNIEKIQIFYNNYRSLENPVLLLFLKHDDFLKHV